MIVGAVLMFYQQFSGINVVVFYAKSVSASLSDRLVVLLIVGGLTRFAPTPALTTPPRPPSPWPLSR
jgi:hypothetical protein